MSDEHFFATCALGWATADTKDEAVSKLVKRFRSDFKDIISTQRKLGTGFGCYIWLCKVHEHSDTPYAIEFYQPVGVETSDHEEATVYQVTKSQIDYALGNPVTRRIAA